MLELRLISEQPEQVRSALLRRGEAAASELGRVLEMAQKRKQLLGHIEGLKHQLNQANEQMKKAAKGPKEGPAAEEFASLREKLRAISDEAKAGDTELRALEEELDELVLRLPNLPAADVPDGANADANVEVRRWGERPAISSAKPHWEI